MSGDTPVEVSCVIVAYRRPVALAQLLQQLRDPRIEIIVVNVGAEPDVTEVSAPAARVIELHENRGYAAGVNAGAQVARASVVLFMNDDLETDVDSVLTLGRSIEAQRADVVVPATRDDTGRIVHTTMSLPTLRGLAVEWMLLPDDPVPLIKHVVRIEKWRDPVDYEPIAAATAAAVAVRTSLLLEEPLPEEYFLYWEESEWFYRLSQRSARVVYLRSASVAHHGRGEIGATKSRLMARNAVRCVRRTKGRWRALAAYFVVVGWNLRLVAIDAARAYTGRGSPTAMRARIAGLQAALQAVGEIR